MLFDGPSRKCKVNTEVECDNRPCDDPDHCMQETTTSTTESTTSMTTTEAGDTTTTSAECVNTFPPGQKCPNHATVNFADINDCSRYWHCEGGCASNVQVLFRHLRLRLKSMFSVKNDLFLVEF